MKRELKVCQDRLAKYSLIEKPNSRNILDDLSAINSVQRHQEGPDPRIKQIISLHNEMFQERRTSLEHILKLTIQTMLSLPYKYLLWSAENNSGPYNIDSMDVTGEKQQLPHTDEWNIFIEGIKANETEMSKTHEFKSVFGKSAIKLKAAVEKLIKVHEEIHTEIKDLHEKVCVSLLPNLSFNSMCSFLKWVYYKVKRSWII